MTTTSLRLSAISKIPFNRNLMVSMLLLSTVTTNFSVSLYHLSPSHYSTTITAGQPCQCLHSSMECFFWQNLLGRTLEIQLPHRPSLHATEGTCFKSPAISLFLEVCDTS